MEQLKAAMRTLIEATDEELAPMLRQCTRRAFTKKEIMAPAGAIPQEIFFICQGITRTVVVDREGAEHTVHFSLENQFIADYASFLQCVPAMQAIQALEAVEAIVLPRNAVAWGYANLKQGEKLGRLIAEYYFTYLDNRLNGSYVLSPRQRYDNITRIFPKIHNRVPQHMIASYLGITPVHLSRLKRAKAPWGKT